MATGLHLQALVLAAGFGSRFGGGKLTADRDGGRLIDAALATAGAAPADGVIVVTGADPAVEAIARDAGALTIFAADHASGLSASLKAGIASLPVDCDGVFVFLGDMPRIPLSVLQPLADGLAAGKIAAQPVHKGQRGHPALISRALFPQIMALTGDAGAGKLLMSLGDQVALIEADEGVLFDVDTRIDNSHSNQDGTDG